METGCRCGRGPGGNYVRTYVRACVRTYVRGRKALGVHMLSRDPGHLGLPPVPAPPRQSKPALAVFRGKGRRPSYVSRAVCLITIRRRLCLGGRLGWFESCPLLSFFSFLPSARSYVRTYVAKPEDPLPRFAAALSPHPPLASLATETGGYPAHLFRRTAGSQPTPFGDGRCPRPPISENGSSLPTP